ncbi:hypothetical protein G7Y89_g12500 [Cudoniella acicularis]|uniref:Uncharacterized protein n=1 Tax=Cudoniella acicularis TaxID=354080 RepID=A0A8H4RBA3_9HELO|nr:hypothetical protein G7Y89_g12500 [Cudoniella acicularis]
MQSQKSSTTMDRKPKTIFQLDSPFTKVEWPEISMENQDTILELLCSLLSPIGQYRSNNVTPSKGKRSKKRKRQDAKTGNNPPKEINPPPPDISQYVVVGLNSVTKVLESSLHASKKTSHDNDSEPGNVHSNTEISKNISVSGDSEVHIPENSASPDIREHFSAVFALRSPQLTILDSHLPQLVATASLSYPKLPAIRLVQLPKDYDKRICESLGLPRVSFIGILEGAPHSGALIDLVRSQVPEVDVPWLRERKSAEYLAVKINVINTFAPVVKEKEKKSA